MCGPRQEEGRDIRIVVGDVWLASVMHHIARVAHQVSPLVCEPELFETESRIIRYLRKLPLIRGVEALDLSKFDYE